MTEYDWQHEIDLRDEAIARIDAELATMQRDRERAERLYFTLRCPVCHELVTAFNDHTSWRIMVHRREGGRCPGSGRRWRMRSRKETRK